MEKGIKRPHEDESIPDWDGIFVQFWPMVWKKFDQKELFYGKFRAVCRKWKEGIEKITDFKEFTHFLLDQKRSELIDIDVILMWETLVTKHKSFEIILPDERENNRIVRFASPQLPSEGRSSLQLCYKPENMFFTYDAGKSFSNFFTVFPGIEVYDSFNVDTNYGLAQKVLVGEITNMDAFFKQNFHFMSQGMLYYTSITSITSDFIFVSKEDQTRAMMSSIITPIRKISRLHKVFELKTILEKYNKLVYLWPSKNVDW